MFPVNTKEIKGDIRAFIYVKHENYTLLQFKCIIFSLDIVISVIYAILVIEGSLQVHSEMLNVITHTYIYIYIL